MQCSEIKEYLRDQALNEPLPTEITAGVKEHLSACRHCRREAETLTFAWSSLRKLDKIRYPGDLTGAVLKRLPGKDKEAGAPWWVNLPRAAYLPAAAAILLLAVGLWFALGPGGWRAGKREIRPGHAASTIRKSRLPLPNVEITLDRYLDQSDLFLRELERGAYATWKEVLGKILNSDLQGQANFLLENLAPDSPARPVVKDLHETFWELLQAGRGNESASANLPAGVDLSGLIRKIEEYRARANGQ